MGGAYSVSRPRPRTAPPALPPFDPLLPPTRARGAGWVGGGSVGGGVREVSVVVVVVGMVVRGGGRWLVKKGRDGGRQTDGDNAPRRPGRGSYERPGPRSHPPGRVLAFPPSPPPLLLLLLLLVFPNPAHPARPGPATAAHPPTSGDPAPVPRSPGAVISSAPSGAPPPAAKPHPAPGTPHISPQPHARTDTQNGCVYLNKPMSE